MITRFKSSLFTRIFSTTAAAICVLFAVMYTLAVPFIQATVEKIESNAGRTILNGVYAMVEQTHRDMEGYRQSIIQERKDQLRNIISVAEARATALEGLVRANKLSKKQALDTLLDEYRKIKYGHDDYIWAADYQSALISHPDPKLHKSDFSQVRDERGNLIVPPMVDGALRQGEGFHAYWWHRLGGRRAIEKLAYYKRLPFFDMVIGTAIYMDDVDATVLAKQASAVESLRHRLQTTHIAKSGYVFIFDGKSQMVIHPNPNIDGKNIANQINPSTQKPIAPQLIAVADNQEGLRYLWDSPADPGNYVHEKISWVRYFKAFDWYICSSAYVDELDESAIILRNRVLGVFVATLLFSFLLIYLFVKSLTNPLRRLRDAALKVERGDLDARCRLNQADEIGVVADAFDGMVGRLQENIQNLDDRVAERTAELHALNHKLEMLSLTDGLTGLANRRRFDEALQEEWARAARSGQTLALGMIDVDKFKKYNDHYGHQAGDECLRQVARVLESSICRASDLVARYGGEEFAFVAPETEGSHALSMAQKICASLLARALPHEISEFGCVTVSIGIAAIVPGDADTPETLIKAADDALYRAKTMGRNQAALF